MKFCRNFKILSTLLVGSLATLTSAESDWKWTIEPYLMATNIDGDVGVGRLLEGAIEVDTSDILETLEIGAMIHAEALHDNGWGFIMDYAFMRLGDKLSGPRDGVNKLTIRQGALEAMAMRRFDHKHGVFDVYGGIRWWDNKVSMVLDLDLPGGSPELKVKESWVDPVIGVRYFAPLSEKWTLALQADVGGFGISSDFSVTAIGGVIYRFTDTFSLDLKYKGIWVDYDNGKSSSADYFKYDTLTHGFIAGLIIEF